MIFDKILIYSVSYFGLFAAVFFFITFFENKKRLKNPKADFFPIVTITVPMFNAGDHLRKTVESLLALNYPKSKLDLIIVDDGSTDNSYEIAKEYLKHKCVRVFHQVNAGKSSALNLALKNARGEFFGVLDVDAFVTPDSLKKLISYFKNEKVMAVTPSLKVYGPKNFLQKVQMIEFLLGVYLRKVFAYLGSIHVTPGCFSIYRKSFFDKTGPYDEGNLTEDIELAFRIQVNDYIIENSFDANVYTLGVNRFKPLLSQRLRWYKGFLDNTLRYKRIFSPKYGNLGMFILPSSFFSVFIAIVMSIFVLSKWGDSWYDMIKTFIAVNFDITPFLQFNFDPFFLNVNGVFFISIISLFISVFTIYIAKRLSDEKQPIAISYVFFVFSYLFLFAFWWMGAAYYKVTNKKIKWGSKLL
jgi:cellulose synthase/poly-beta-1,6-N-acetylglucosamine synthase-like glycosyltransferase